MHTHTPPNPTQNRRRRVYPFLGAVSLQVHDNSLDTQSIDVLAARVKEKLGDAFILDVDVQPLTVLLNHPSIARDVLKELYTLFQLFIAISSDFT